MDELREISELLRDTYEGNPWHGSSLKDILSGVTARMAANRGVTTAHTIWEIVSHIEVWMEIVRLRLTGRVFEATVIQDWPAVGATTDEAWIRSLEKLQQAYVNLQESINRLNADELQRKAAGEDYDIYTMLHGVINHNVYHSAQISLMKKEVAIRT